MPDLFKREKDMKASTIKEDLEKQKQLNREWVAKESQNLLAKGMIGKYRNELLVHSSSYYYYFLSYVHFHLRYDSFFR